MRLLKQSSTAQALMFLMIDSSDHISGKTGLSTAGGSPTLVVTISKNGGTFATPSGSVTEVGNGYYKIAGNATDNNTLGPLIIHATGTGADPTDVEFVVVAFDPLSATDLGLSRLDADVSSRSTLDASTVWANATRTLTAGDNIVLAKGTGVTGFNDLSAGDVRSAVGLASANLDTQLGDLPTAAENADAVWDETLADHLTAGSTGAALNAAGSAGDPWSTALPGSYGAGTAGKILGDNLDATVSSRLASADISLSGGAVTVGTINNDVITNASIANNAITQTKIATNAIGPGQIAPNAITVSEIADGAITATKFADDAITAAKIADGAITAAKFANNAITAATIAADAIDYDKITENARIYIANQVWSQDSRSDMNTEPYAAFTFGQRVLRGESAQASVSVTGSHHVAAVVHSMEPDVLTADALAADAANEIADAFLNRNIAGGSSSGRVVQDALKILRNRFVVSSGTLTVYEENDTTPAWTSVVTSDAAADPIIESNPV